MFWGILWKFAIFTVELFTGIFILLKLTATWYNAVIIAKHQLTTKTRTRGTQILFFVPLKSPLLAPFILQCECTAGFAVYGESEQCALIHCGKVAGAHKLVLIIALNQC